MRMGFRGAVALLVLGSGLAWARSASANDSEHPPLPSVPVALPSLPAAEAKPSPESPGIAEPAPSQQKSADGKIEESEEPPATEPQPLVPKPECIPPDRPGAATGWNTCSGG